MNKSTNNKVEKFINSLMEKKKIKNISNKLNLLDSGIIDSLDFVKFISQVEKRFKIKFSSQDISKLSIANLEILKKLINKKIK